MDITKLEPNLKKVIVSAWGVGWNDGGIGDIKKLQMTDTEIINYLDNIFNPKTETNES